MAKTSLQSLLAKNNNVYKTALAAARKKEQEEKEKQYAKETAAQRARRILAEGNGPQKVGQDPDEARWYAKSGKAAQDARISTITNKNNYAETWWDKADALEPEIKQAVKDKNDQKYGQLSQKQREYERKAMALDEAEPISMRAKRAGADAQKKWDDLVTKLDEKDPASPKNTLEKLPEYGGKHLEKREVEGLILPKRQVNTQVNTQNAQGNTRAKGATVLDESLWNQPEKDTQTQTQLEGWGVEKTAADRMAELKSKSHLTGEEQEELAGLNSQWGYMVEAHGGLDQWRAAIDEGMQKPVGEAADADRAARKAHIEGQIPGYEESIAYNGFDKKEFQDAVRQQTFEADMYKKLQEMQRMGIKPKAGSVIEKPVNPAVLMAQLEDSMASRAQKYQSNMDAWKQEVLQGQEKDLQEIEYWEEQRELAISQGLSKDKINKIDQKIEELKGNTQSRADAVVQVQPDFVQNSAARPQFAQEDNAYWLINWEAMTEFDPRMNPYGYRGEETKDQLYERLLAMDAPYDPKLFYLTDEERATYNYYYYHDKLDGTKEAAAYLQRIDNRLSKRLHDYSAKRAYKMGKENPAMALLANTLLMPMDALGYGRTFFDMIQGKDSNPYGGAFSTYVARAAGTEGGASVYNTPVEKGIYNIVKGLGEVGASIMAGPIGKYLMAASVATGQTYDALTRVGSSFEGWAEGSVAALTELLTEGTIGRFGEMVKLGKQTGKGAGEIARRMLQGFVDEYAEELPGNLINTLFDRWIMGLDSRWELDKKETGKTDKQMWQQLWADMNEEGLMGGITGAILGGAGYVGSKAQAKRIAADIQAKMPDVSEEMAQSIAEQAVGLKPENQQEQAEFAQAAAEAQALAEAKDPFDTPALVKGIEAAGQLPVDRVTGIADLKGDQLTVTLEGGGTAKLEDVVFDNLDMRAAYEHAARQPDAHSARAYLSSWKESGQPVSVFDRAFSKAFKQGREMGGMHGATILNDQARRTAYKAGETFQRGIEAVLDTPSEVNEAIQNRIAAMPRELDAADSGAVIMAKTGRINPVQAVQVALMDEYGKKNGIKYVIVDTIHDGKANAMYKDGAIYVALDAVEGNLTRAATHDGWHYLKDTLGKDSREIKGMETLVLSILQRSKGYDLETRIAQVQEAYKRAFDQDLDRDAAIEEIVADSMFDVFSRKENLQALMDKDMNAAQKFVEWVKRFARQMREAMRRIRRSSPEARAMHASNQEAMKKGLSEADAIVEAYNFLMEEAKEKKARMRDQNGQKRDQEGQKREDSGKYQAQEGWYDYSKPFAQQVEDWINGEFPKNDTLLLGRTPKVFKQIGFSDIPLTMDQTHLDYVVNGTKNEDHRVAMVMLQNLPELLKEPIAIIESATHPDNSVVAIIDATVNGKQMVAAFRISSNGLVNGYAIDANHMVSVQGRNNAVSKLLETAIEKENKNQIGVYYFDKKRGVSILKREGLQLPSSLNRGSLIHSIFDAGSPVNRKFINQTDTQQFKRWFGNSKVVDAEGNPLVMYHGTAEEFWQFDKRKANDALGRRMGLGAGKGKFYLSEFKGVGQAAAYSAKSMGRGKQERVMELYVSAQKVMDRSEYERRLKEEFKKNPGSDPSSGQYDYRARDKAIAAVDRAIRKEGYDSVWDRESGELFVYEPTQIKSATDNVGTFDPENPDIRYSIQDTEVDDEPETMFDVQMENQRLKKSLSQAQALLNSRGEHVVNDPQAIRRMASALIAQTQSTYDEKRLASNLRDIYNALSNAQDDFDYQAAMRDMNDLARAVIEKSVRMDNELAEEYEDLRRQLRTMNISLTDSQKAEAAKLYGDYETFRKKYMGSLRLTRPENGISLTSLWTELSEEYPALFPADTAEGNMITVLADVVEALKPTYSNIYGQNMAEGAYDLAVQMWEGFLSVPQVTSQKQRQIDQLKTDLNELRREHRDTTWKFKRMSEKYAEQENRIANMANQRRINQETLQAKTEITRIAKSLSKQLLKDTNQQHIPKNMRGVTGELLAMLDFKTEKTGPEVARILEDLHTQYLAAAAEAEKNEEGESYTFDTDVADLMEAAAMTAKEGKKPLSQMNLEELQLIRDAMRAMRHLVSEANELFVDNKKRTATAAGDDTIATLNSWESKTPSRFGIIRATGDMLQRGLIKPVYFFEQLEGTPIYDAFKNIRKGEAQHTRQIEQAEEYLMRIMRQTGYDPKAWKLDEELKISDEWRLMEEAKGKEAKRPQLVMTRGELMMLYATAKREALTGTQHLEKGGVEFESQRYVKKEKNARFQISLEQVKALAEGNLTKEQRAYVDKLVEYLSTVCAAQGNVVSNKLYGIDKFKEKYYVPFKTAGNYLKSDPAAGVDSRLATGSFTKNLTEKAKTPLTIRDFTEVWCEHVEKMSAYAAFALPLEDFNRIYNSKGTLDDHSPADQSVKASISYALGERGKGYIDVFLKDMNGNNRNPIGSATMLNRLTSLAKGTSIGFNLSVAVQQMSAGPRAYAMIDGKYMAAGMAKGLNYKKSFEQLKEYAPIATQKEWGYFDTNMSRSLYDRVSGGWRQKMSDVAGWLPQQGDRINWAQIWEAVKLEVADAYEGEFERGSKAHLEKAGERFTEVIDHTQVADSVLQRAEWARSKDGLTKALVSFMSEPITQYNMIWSAANKLLRAKGMEKGAARSALIKSGRKTLTAVVTSMVLNSALQALAAALRDRNNEKKVKDEDGNTVIVGVRSYGDKWRDAFESNLLSAPFSMLPFVSDAFSMIQGYDPSRMDMQVLDKLIKAGTYMWEVLSGKKEADGWKMTYNIAEAISYTTGVPISNLMRDGYAAWQTGVESLSAGLLPGSAWDEGKTVAQRLEAAKANYVMNKVAGDSRKENTNVYYNILLEAWYQGGAESKEFNDVLNTMISQGTKASTIYSGFKSRLGKVEELVAQGANALAAVDYEGYEKAYTALMDKGIPFDMAKEMIASALPKEEAAPIDVEDEMASAMQKFTTGQGKQGVSATAYSYVDLIDAMESGNAKNRDRVLSAFEKAGIQESSIRSQVTGEYRKRYIAAVNSGDTQEANRIQKLLIDSGLDYDREDLDAWWEDDAFDQLYAAVEEGDIQKARKLQQSITAKTGDDSATWNRITSYYARKYKDLYKRDYKAAMAMKTKLVQLGMYESTIAKWEKAANKERKEQK